MTGQMGEPKERLREVLRLATQLGSRGSPPFAASIWDGEGHHLATGINAVPSEQDPTHHAEMAALRAAAKYRKSARLDSCVIVCSCEPCAMCRGGIILAGLALAMFSAPREVAEKFGFSDYSEAGLVRRAFPASDTVFVNLLSEDGNGPFETWANATRRGK